MKRVLFVIDEMRMGGVSKVLIELLKVLDRNRYAVDLLVLHKTGELIKDIPEDINILNTSPFFSTIDIPLKQCTLKNIFRKLMIIFYMKTGLIFKRLQKERKRLLERDYDVEIAYKEGFCTVFVASGNHKKINFIHSDYKIYNYAHNYMSTFKKALSNIDINIAVSDTVRDSFKEVFGISDVITIHNLIDEKRIKSKMNDHIDIYDRNKINLVTVGRLHYQKGYDILLDVYKEVKDHYTLTIIGDGDKREELEAMNDRYQLGVRFLGMIDEPYSYIHNADMFVLSSRYEGYPTVVIESLLCETPVLSTEVAGIKEQLTEDHYGFIVPNDKNALLAKLLELKDQKELLRSYKDKLKDYHYENEAILKKIEDVIDKD